MHRRFFLDFSSKFFSKNFALLIRKPAQRVPYIFFDIGCGSYLFIKTRKLRLGKLFGGMDHAILIVLRV